MSDYLAEAALRWLRSTIQNLDAMSQTKRRPSTVKETFGQRLARLRRARGLTQRALAAQAKVSHRMIAHYETKADGAPPHVLPVLAKVLEVSVDDLLGVTPHASEPFAADVRIIRRLHRIQQLPAGTRKAILKILDSLLATHGGQRDVAA